MKGQMSRRTIAAAAVASAAMLLAACGGGGSAGSGSANGGGNGGNGAEGETYTLTVANFNHADAPETRAVDWWLDEVEKRTDGRVTFERYHQQTLCTGPEIVQCVRDGRADIGATIPSYTAGLFRVSEVMNLPFHSNNPEAVTQAFYALMQEDEQARAEVEGLGLYPLYFNGVDISIIGGTEPLESIDDLKGKNVRSAGEGVQWAYESIGANPVSVTAAEMYEGMQHGLLDVWTNNLSGADDYKMFEVTNHWAQTGLGLYVNNFQFMSQSAYDSLPKDIQQIIDEVTADLVAGDGYREMGAGLDEKCQNILASGQLETWTVWSEEETQRWRDALGDKAIDNWKNAVADVVDDPDALYDRYLELLAEAEESSEFVSPAVACAESV